MTRIITIGDRKHMTQNPSFPRLSLRLKAIIPLLSAGLMLGCANNDTVIGTETVADTSTDGQGGMPPGTDAGVAPGVRGPSAGDAGTGGAEGQPPPNVAGSTGVQMHIQEPPPASPSDPADVPTLFTDTPLRPTRMPSENAGWFMGAILHQKGNELFFAAPSPRNTSNGRNSGYTTAYNLDSNTWRLLFHPKDHPPGTLPPGLEIDGIRHQLALRGIHEDKFIYQRVFSPAVGPDTPAGAVAMDLQGRFSPVSWSSLGQPDPETPVLMLFDDPNSRGLRHHGSSRKTAC